MTGVTAELGLATATDVDDIEVYNVTNLAATLVALDALFSFTSGHDHSSAHKGKPIPSTGLAQPLALTSPVLTAPSMIGPTITTGGLTVTAGTLTMGASPAGAGLIRLPAQSAIDWRNVANTNDHSISFNATDQFQVTTNLTTTLRWDGITPFLQLGSNLSPAGSGILRLPAQAAIDWRNVANTTDHSISFNISDQLEVTTNLVPTLRWDGTSQYLQLGSNTNPAGAGILRVPNNKSIDWRNAGNTADDSISFDANDRLAIATIAGNVVLTVGAAGSATAMPTPQEYMVVTVNGNARRIALFN